MQAVLDACNDVHLNTQPCVIVISNNSNSEALQRAKQEGIPDYHPSATTHPNPIDLDEAILKVLQKHQTELIILAGYMRKLGTKTLTHYKGKVINIHPALLPKYGGQGMFGHRVHAAVLKAGEKETGVTIHLVDEEYDHGTIIAQCRISVKAQDTVEISAQRVLNYEHVFLVDTIQKIITGRLPLKTENKPF